MQEFLACAPCFGENLSEKLYMEKRQKWLDSLSDEERESYYQRRIISFRKNQKELERRRRIRRMIEEDN